MRKFLFFMSVLVFIGGMGLSSISAATLTEDFEAQFPAWESGWLGTNSNLQNYYGIGQYRGNNPDGLWIADNLPSNGNTQITFNPAFGASLNSFNIDIATWVYFNFQVYDMSNNLLLNQAVVPNHGAYTDPGTYYHFSTLSSNGISKFTFMGSNVEGNTSIDNVTVTTTPEPASIFLFLIGSGLLGIIGYRKNKKTN